MRVPSAVLESVADCREESGHALPLTNTDNWRQRRWWSCEAELGLRVCWVLICFHCGKREYYTWLIGRYQYKL